MDAGRLKEAEDLFRAALRLSDRPETRMGLGLCLLAQGRYTEGWPLWEARFEALKRPQPTFPWPVWCGQPVAGKRLLVWLDGWDATVRRIWADLLAQKQRDDLSGAARA